MSRYLWFILFFIPHFLTAQDAFQMPETGEQVIEACNGILYDAGGVDGDYSEDNQSFTLIQATDGDFLELTFTEFDLENSFDFLVIFTGSELDPQVIGQYSGSELPNNGNPILVNSNQVGIFFSSDFTINGAGFAMEFNCTEFTDPPVANAGFPAFTCLGGVQFTDISTGFPNSWSWDFGDGNTSTEQNPVHVYTTPGIYNISLTACNDNGCDTFTATEALEYNTDDFNCTNGVVMQQYGSITTNLCEGIFFDPGGADGDYPEGSYSELIIEPLSSAGVTLTFTEFNLGNIPNNHDQLVILDANTGEQLDVFTGDDLPNAGQPLTYDVSPLIVQFYADHNNNFSGFAVLWQANGLNTPPIANIGIDDLNVPLNTPVIFTDNSENNPGAWNWNFGDGNTSTEQNPSNIFTEPGTYEVSLNVSNCAGSDEAETVIITVQEAPEITVNPTSFEVTVDAGTTLTDNLNLCNIGAGDLAVSLQATNDGSGFGFSFGFTTNENGADFSWQLLDADLNIIQQSQQVFLPFQTYDLNFSGLDENTEYMILLNSPEGVQALALFSLIDPITGQVIYEQLLPTGPEMYYLIGLPAMGNFSSEWLTTETSPTLITTDNCEDYTVTFDATDLNGGVYTGEITIATNDPNNPFITIPVTMTVVGTPEIAVSAQNLDFGDVQVGGSSTLSFTITNDGTDVLNLNNVASSQAIFDLNTEADFNLNPGESRTIDVTFTPTEITAYTETISIENNAGANVEVSLTGNGIAAPFLTIDPTEFTLEMIAGEDTTLNVNLGNIGEADLNFDIITSTSGNGFSFMFTTDFWGGEFSWNVTNNAGEIVQNSDFGEYGSNTTYTEIITGLVTGETYTLNMFDSFGDGALTAYSITDIGTGQVIDEGDFTVPNNPFQLSVVLGSPSESFIETTPDSGIIGINGSQVLDIYLDTEGLATGVYEIVVTVATNDPLQPTADVNITLFVIAPVETDFSASPTFVCGNIPVQFMDETANVATSWTWDFGDGTTSTEQNPTHTYTADGSYTVSLIACNALGCETMVKTNYISVEIDCYTENIPPEHLTETITVCEGTVYDSGGPTGDYLEGNNGTLIIAPPGATSLSITFSEFNYEEHADFLYVYDGEPFTGTLLVSATGNDLAGVTLTSTTGVLSLIEYTGHFVQLSGFVATFTCDAEPVLPEANFTFIGDTVCVNEPFLFFGESNFAADSWTWNFGDGSTADVQNPLHNYTDSGIYEVTLTACLDTICDTYIEQIMVELDKTCFQDSISADGEVTYINNCFGTLYDSGGSEGNYQNNSNGIFTILTENGTIELTFTEFNYAPEDFLIIFDGNEASGNILGILSGSELPEVINSTLPAVTIVEFSDGANTDSGFALNYLCSSATTEPLLMVFNDTPCDGMWNFATAEDIAYDSYDWNFGDGTTSTEATPSHEFPHAGHYDITLTACLQGDCETQTRTIYSNKLIPAIGAPATAMVNQEIQLHGLTEAATHWEWDLGNGEIADHNTPTTTYSEAGIYDIHVHLTNMNVHEQCTATHTHTIEIVEEGTTATTEELGRNIRVFPNPMSDNLTIDFAEAVSQSIEIRLRTIDGKIVLAQPYENTIDVGDLPAGSYFLEVLIEGETPRQFKVMKQ